jgi:hypothetical protein
MAMAPAIEATARRRRTLLVALAIGLAVGLDACSKVDDAAAPSCTYGVAPMTASFGPTGGTGSLAVSAAGICSWSVTGAPAWVSLTGADNGKGNGSVGYAVAANSGATDRSASLTIAGIAVNLTQSASTCAFAVDPLSASTDASGGSGTITVTTGGGCAWSASSDASWISITGSASGTGNGSIHYAVGPNPGSESRTGTMAVAGRTVTLTQAGSSPSPGPVPPGTPCEYSISPTTGSLAADGGTGSIVVSAPAGCAWTSSSGVPWMSVTGSSAGGSGTAKYTVAANPAPAARTGTLTVAGQSFSMMQAGVATTGCTYAINPSSISAPPGGGSVSVNVIAPTGCAWTTIGGDSWISIVGSDRGAGNGSVTFAVTANVTTTTRAAALTVADQPLTINQDPANQCRYTVAPTSVSLPATGGGGSVTVSAGTNCAWTAVANAPWITITAGASGTSNGSVQFTAAANTDTSLRTGALTIAGQTVTVTESSALPLASAVRSNVRRADVPTFSRWDRTVHIQWLRPLRPIRAHPPARESLTMSCCNPIQRSVTAS